MENSKNELVSVIAFEKQARVKQTTDCRVNGDGQVSRNDTRNE